VAERAVGGGGASRAARLPDVWTIGLVQTVWARVRGKTANDACLDGACRLDRRHGA